LSHLPCVTAPDPLGNPNLTLIVGVVKITLFRGSNSSARSWSGAISQQPAQPVVRTGPQLSRRRLRRRRWLFDQTLQAHLHAADRPNSDRAAVAPLGPCANHT